jgi:hypothetical protein
MTNVQTHETDAFQRSKNFGIKYTAKFPDGSVGAKLFAQVAAAVPQAQGQAVDQKSAQSDREQATLTKAQIHPDLHDQLKAISESAHTLADLGAPGLEAKFRMPRSAGHGALLTAARQFLKDATPMKAQFLTVNLPADFLDTLDQTITNFDNATDDQSGGAGDQVHATVGLAGTTATARKALRNLRTIVRNTFKNDPAVLAEWEAASHIDPRKAHQATPAPTPTPPATPKP